jgi:hypothetical protein
MFNSLDQKTTTYVLSGAGVLVTGDYFHMLKLAGLQLDGDRPKHLKHQINHNNLFILMRLGCYGSIISNNLW